MELRRDPCQCQAPYRLWLSALTCALANTCPRLEMIIAWEQLFDQVSQMRLDCDPTELEYMPNILLRGLENLPVVFES